MPKNRRQLGNCKLPLSELQYNVSTAVRGIFKKVGIFIYFPTLIILSVRQDMEGKPKIKKGILTNEYCKKDNEINTRAKN